MMTETKEEVKSMRREKETEITREETEECQEKGREEDDRDVHEGEEERRRRRRRRKEKTGRTKKRFSAKQTKQKNFEEVNRANVEKDCVSGILNLFLSRKDYCIKIDKELLRSQSRGSLSTKSTDKERKKTWRNRRQTKMFLKHKIQWIEKQISVKREVNRKVKREAESGSEALEEGVTFVFRFCNKTESQSRLLPYLETSR